MECESTRLKPVTRCRSLTVQADVDAVHEKGNPLREREFVRDSATSTGGKSVSVCDFGRRFSGVPSMRRVTVLLRFSIDGSGRLRAVQTCYL